MRKINDNNERKKASKRHWFVILVLVLVKGHICSNLSLAREIRVEETSVVDYSNNDSSILISGKEVHYQNRLP